MFDKMVESASRGSLRAWGRSFTAASAAVTAAFLVTLGVSLYGKDFSLVAGGFDDPLLLAPAIVDPQPAAPRSSSASFSGSSRAATAKTVNLPPAADPLKIPDKIATSAGLLPSRSGRDYLINRTISDFGGPTAPGDPNGPSGGTGSEPLTDSADQPAQNATDISKVPPLPIKKSPAVSRRPISLGPIAGRAVFLPKPAYSSAAQMLGIQGNVTVQVTVDEGGNVIASKAIDGPQMLRGAAENAAREARFSPTRLGNQAVKVTGIIIYKFSKT